MDLHESLGDGLVLRRATPADSGALVEFNGEMHSAEGDDSPERVNCRYGAIPARGRESSRLR